MFKAEIHNDTMTANISHGLTPPKLLFQCCTQMVNLVTPPNNLNEVDPIIIPILQMETMHTSQAARQGEAPGKCLVSDYDGL